MIEKKKKWKLADFDYPLPEKYIAQYPAKRRDLSKLMVLHRETGKIEHKTFSALPKYLRRNDLVILNNTKVFPARLYASKENMPSVLNGLGIVIVSTPKGVMTGQAAKAQNIGGEVLCSVF